MLLKKSMIVQLISDDLPIMIEKDGERVTTFPKGALVYNSKIMPSLKIVKKDEIIGTETGYNRIHLYLLIEDEIKLNDIILMGNSVGKVLKDNKLIGNKYQKVIASSDRILGLPKFSKGLLTQYVEKQGIEQVYTVFEEITTLDENTKEINISIIPKVNRNNIVSLRKVKTNYTNNEVLDLLKKFAKDNNVITNVISWASNHM